LIFCKPAAALEIDVSEVATCCHSVAASAAHHEKSGNKAATNRQHVAALPLQTHSKISFEVLCLGLGWVQSENFLQDIVPIRINARIERLTHGQGKRTRKRELRSLSPYFPIILAAL
jgi:hypothetical protein